MSQRQVTITLNVPFMSWLLAVLLAHGFITLFKITLPEGPSGQDEQKLSQNVFKISDVSKIRTAGKKDGSKTNDILFKVPPAPKANPFSSQAAMNNPNVKPGKTATQPPSKTVAQNKTASPYRPTMRASALEQLVAKSESFATVAQKNTQSGGAASLAGSSPTLSKSLMNMQVEIPEGVELDKLNEFELKFYGFQKRMFEKYVNAIMLQVRDYEKKYSIQVLMPDGKHVMTGRVVFDSEGNLKQIKMMRWTQADKLQAMFEDILKSMESLPNPPKILRNTNGDFVVFYTLTVDNG